MKREYIVGSLVLLFGLALAGFTPSAHAAETGLQQKDLADLQKALNSLEMALSSLSSLISLAENAPEATVLPVAEMNAVLGGISNSLIGLRGELARLDMGSNMALGAELPEVEAVAGEKSEETSLFASLNLVSIAIPSLIVLLTVLIFIFAFMGRKADSQTATS